MKFLDKIFGRVSTFGGEASHDHDPLIPVPIPALVTLLIAKERAKGAPLTQVEVLEVRDNAGCVMLPLSQKLLAEEERGYPDIDPENAWIEWLEVRASMERE